MQSMKGATSLLGSMNRQMNLPALQRIAMEFERENDIMDQRQEMMDDAIDDVTGIEDEEEGEEVLNQVFDEIGVDLNQAVSRRLRLERVLLSDKASSLAKPLLVYRRMQSQKAAWHKLLGGEVERTTICKPDWIVCGGSTGICSALVLRVLGSEASRSHEGMHRGLVTSSSTIPFGQ